MVQTLELQATQDGIIWRRRPLVSSKGLLSCVKNLPLSSYDKRPATFRAVTFNTSGDLLAATDERGRVFVFYVTANRYALVQHLGTPTTHCCFSPTHKTELLVTCEDKTVRCIDVKTQKLISTLQGHKLAIQCASFQKSGQLALTASQDAVILWDTKDWSRYRVLNAGPGVEDAKFVFRKDLVAVCFHDGTIMMWELTTLTLKYKFSLPEEEESPGLQKIAVSDDHQVLVASGKTPFIYVWKIESQTIIRIMELPLPIKQVVRHAFLPEHNTMISLLVDDGGVVFLDVAAKDPQINLEISNRGRTISTFDIECHARYLAASTSDGFLLLYDMDIARKTTANAQERQRKEGFIELDDHARIRTRSGLEKIDFSDDVDPAADSNEWDLSAPEHNRPVPSKLIDSLFGAKYPRQAMQTANQTRSCATTAIYTECSRMLPASATRARVRAAIGSFSVPSKKAMANAFPKLRKDDRTRRPSPLSRPPAQLTVQEIEINRRRLVGFLKCNGMYPKKYRVLVWRFLLRLPKNEEAFRLLVAKGKHPVFTRLKDDYQLQKGRIFRRLHRILSAMVNWCPAFGKVSYLPAIVYPFVKIFRENDLAAFEASLSVMLHWCGECLVDPPYPPVIVMSAIEKELARREPRLYDHLTQYEVASEVYAWSLLKTIFTEVLSEDEWMCLWDHLFTWPDTPQLVFVAVLAYLSYFRTALLAACDRFSIEQFFHQQNAINIQKFIQLMMNLRDKLDLDDFAANKDLAAADSITRGHGRFWPLSRGQYPAFAHYPRLAVDSQISECNRIALEEAELSYKQKLLDQTEKVSKKLKTEHEKWMKDSKLIIDTQKRRQKEAIAAERERMLHLITLDYETRQRRLQHLTNMELSAHKTLEEIAKMLQSEYQKLVSTLAAQKEQMELEVSSRKQKKDLQGIEFETHDWVHEIDKQRKRAERLSRLRTEFETQVKRQELQDMLRLESWKRVDEEKERKAKMRLRHREKCALQSQENRVYEELDKQLFDQQLAKDNEISKYERSRRARHNEQQECDELNHEINGRKDAYLKARDHTEKPRVQAQETEDKNFRHHSRDLTHKEAATRNGADNAYRDHRNRDDAANREESRSQCNVLANDEIQGNASEGNEPLPRTSDDVSNKFAVHTQMQGPPSSESSMSSANGSCRRTMADTSLLEKALGNLSSSSSSHRSDSSMEYILVEAAADEASSTHSTGRREDSTMQEEEVKSEDQYAATISPTRRQSSPEAALGFSHVENEALKIPHTMQTFLPEHFEEVVAPPAAHQTSQAHEDEGQFPLQLAVENDDATSTSGAVSDLSQVHHQERPFPVASRNLSPAQQEDESISTLQAAGVYTCANYDEQSTLEATPAYLRTEKPTSFPPRANSKPFDSDAAGQSVVSVDDLIESLHSDSEGDASSTAMDVLQRPIAELEKKLGIRFDDFSDEEMEDEAIEDDSAELLQRAKQLLELSSFDTDSDNDL
ncbi:unnamed protein product [Peronospora effusa]|nr:unnamed protein product [Peronospora effusa]